MELKNSISEYTELEFLAFLKKIWAVDVSEKEHDALIHHFVMLTEHPHGNGLLFYPNSDVDNSPEGILEFIKKWRAENGKPGFKE